MWSMFRFEKKPKKLQELENYAVQTNWSITSYGGVNAASLHRNLMCVVLHR